MKIPVSCRRPPRRSAGEFPVKKSGDGSRNDRWSVPSWVNAIEQLLLMRGDVAAEKAVEDAAA